MIIEIYQLNFNKKVSNNTMNIELAVVISLLALFSVIFKKYRSGLKPAKIKKDLLK